VLFALGILCLWTAGLWGLFYRGTEVSYSEAFISVQSETLDFGSSTMVTRELWNARCSVCHGKDGNLNRKFVHEYYPLPQSLSLSRIDSLGEDSLQKVILEGRNYMQPFRGRVSKEEALALVRFLRTLAVQKDSGGEQ
jgi:cytochrome c5